jgi:hypothetical protein
MAKRGRPFQPGNKLGRGRPSGSRNKKTVLIEELLADNSEPLLRKALQLALKGNTQMLRLLLDPVLRRPKDAPVTIGRLPMGTPEELLQSQARVMQELASGKLSLNQVEQIFQMLENARKLMETRDHNQRVRAMEQLLEREEPDKAA